MTARFIAFEGGDASGKTTQARRVAKQLPAHFTREPGGTELGEKLRGLVLEPDVPTDLRAEALMIAAARAQHVAELIRPAIARGIHVVTDRFTGSSIAYQGHGSGLAVAEVAALSAFATDDLVPDLTVLIDVPVEQTLARIGDRPGGPDRFEREAGDFHERVREGYLSQASADPDGWAVIDGSGALEVVAGLVEEALAERLSLRLGTMGR